MLLSGPVLVFHFCTTSCHQRGSLKQHVPPSRFSWGGRPGVGRWVLPSASLTGGGHPASRCQPELRAHRGLSGSSSQLLRLTVAWMSSGLKSPSPSRLLAGDFPLAPRNCPQVPPLPAWQLTSSRPAREHCCGPWSPLGAHLTRSGPAGTGLLVNSKSAGFYLQNRFSRATQAWE